MSLLNQNPRRCPKTGRPIIENSSRRWSRWLLPVAGLISLIWFLVRVIPKPSRAAYPCQRVAAPMAGSFILWILGMAISAYAYSRGKASILKSRWGKAALFAVIAGFGFVVVITNLPKPSLKANPLSPIGVAKGIHPGRVVWVWNPGATNWAGPGSGQRWYDNACTNPYVCQSMMSQAVRELTGKETDAAAWDALFRHYNITHGRGDVGYQPGEKIMIKINLSGCNAAYAFADDAYNKTSEAIDWVDNSPQLMLALLRHLVEVVGMNQSDITIGDSTGLFANHLYVPLHNAYPNVNYMDNRGTLGRTREQFSNTRFNWSTSAANGKLADYVPVSIDSATYLINFAVLKAHSSGVTNCGKNHYGSLIRCPDGNYRDANGTDQWGYLDYYDLHLSLPNPGWSPGTGKYRAIVDLMGSKKLGDKTVLYLIDGLYAGYYWEGMPVKWQMPPFNNDWPSSLFASQDPVAIDSVAYDFLNREWPDKVAGSFGSLEGGAEDYIHEAALADNPPSGTFYDPEKDGIRMQSLGVHEHWNNAIDKKYSRNLGVGNGIELVSVTEDKGAVKRAKLAGDSQTVNISGAAVTATFVYGFYVESDDRTVGIQVRKISHGMTIGRRANVFGTISTDISSKERYINPTTISDAGPGTVLPLYTNLVNFGGADWNYDPATGAGQQMIPGGTGLNNIGLLMRASGKVIDRNASTSPYWFVIDDGSMPGVGVKCLMPSASGMPALHTHVKVTGISSCERSGGAIRRLIRVVSVD